jgi:hypothetical protein
MSSGVEPHRRARPVSALLLAFLVWTLQPAFEARPHRHAGGDLPHVHLDGVRASRTGATSHDVSDAARPPAPAGSRIERARDAGLHYHLVRALHAAWASTALVRPQADGSVRLLVAASLRPPAADHRAGNARGPPLQPGS